MYNKTYEQIKADILSRITLTDKREGSFVHDMISPIALELEKVYAQFDRIIDMAFISELSGEYLDKRAEEYGVPRRTGTQASGTITVYGTAENAPVLNSDYVFLTNENYRYIQTGTVTTTTIEGVQAVVFDAKSEAVGSQYNLPDTTPLTATPPIIGAASIVFSTAMTGGTDPETDDDLRARLLEHLQKPATSGNANEYRQWALEVDGVGDVKVFSGRNSNYGAGTHTWNEETGAVLIFVVDVNKERFYTTTIPDAVKSYIEGKRPIGAKVYVTRGTAITLSVAASVTIDTTTTISDVRTQFTKMFTDFVRDSVFKRNVIDYNRVLSMFYDIEGVISATCTLNNGTSNINIYEHSVPMTGTVTITEAT